MTKALVTDDTGVAGGGSNGFEAETGSGIGIAGTGSDAVLKAGTGAGSGSFVGEVVAELVSPAFGGFLFSRVTSVQLSSVL